MLIISVAPVMAYADDPESLADDTADWENGIEEVYETAKIISIPLAAVSFATAAMKMLGLGIWSAKQGDREMDSGKRQLIFTVLAVAALWLLPSVISLGVNLGKGHEWDPTALGN